MKILGIDPGYNIIGYGVIETNGCKCKVVDFGVITTPKTMSISKRLYTIYQACIELMETFKPDEVAFEELFFNTNNTTAIPVAEARGALIVACKQYNDRLFEYTPLQIKQALTGNGRAEKKQVQFMVKNVLGLTQTPKPDDAADALAVALCHMQTNGVMSDNSI
ncbi:MAG TPA: crossover junction endodeoxyribonuclease RuvC [Candidatus Onthoplasma faecipullorum]|nr:crossover junction endodeoxyribonuclease RuvC [Candidatus Onthoplasma faecipullorum]